MSIEKIRAEIANVKQELQIPMPEDYRFKPSHEMRFRQNTSKLEELGKVFRDSIKVNTKIHLISWPVVSTLSPFIFDHTLVAQRLAKFIMPSVTPGSTLNAYQIAPLNEILDVVFEELGLMLSMRPTLSVIEKFNVVIQDYNHLVNVLEGMLEYFLKNTGSESEGHDVQALYVAKQYLDGIEKQPLTDDVLNIAVFVPNMSPDVVNSYSKYLSSNIVQVNVNTDEELANYLNENITKLMKPKISNKKNK